MTGGARVIVPALLLAAAGAVYVSAATAGPQATFAVGATVLPHTAVTYAAAPSAIVISPADVRRGYIDVATPTRLELSVNDPRGFAIDVWPAAGLVAAMSVRGAGAEVAFGRDGGSIVQRSLHGGAISVTLTWRFVLDAGLTPGRYPWPLQLAVRPLADGQ